MEVRSYPEPYDDIYFETFSSYIFFYSVAQDSHWASCYRMIGVTDPTELTATSGNASIIERVNLIGSEYQGLPRARNIYSTFRDDKSNYLDGSNGIFEAHHVIVQSNRGFLGYLLAHPKYGQIMAKAGLSPCNVFGVLMNRYFRPTTQLVESVHRLLPWWTNNKPFDESVHQADPSVSLAVGIHVRTGDTSFRSLAPGEEEPGFQGGLKKFSIMLESAKNVILRESHHSSIANRSSVILVLSDSQHLKAYVRAMNDSSLVVSDPKPEHINHNEFSRYHRPIDESALEHIIVETYTEWYAYSTMNIFIAGGYLKIGGIYDDSGFSRTAMFRGLGDGRYFEAFGGAIVDPRNSKSLHEDSCVEFMEQGAKI